MLAILDLRAYARVKALVDRAEDEAALEGVPAYLVDAVFQNVERAVRERNGNRS